jgi:hypothetical protein
MRIAGVAAAVAIALAIGTSSMALIAHAAEPDFAAYCAKVRDDDMVRPVPAALAPLLSAAFAKLVGSAPTDSGYLSRTGQVRCMDGKVLVCFTGANLPCAKIRVARDNAGAVKWCEANPGTEVPAFAIGHDALYSYRCDGKRAHIVGTNWTLDHRGFATSLWTPLN